jgi:hypothetical protein
VIIIFIHSFHDTIFFSAKISCRAGEVNGN